MKLEKTANESTEFATGVLIDPIEFREILNNAVIVDVSNKIDDSPLSIK